MWTVFRFSLSGGGERAYRDALDILRGAGFRRAGGATGALAVNGALALYLDFVNLFLSLLRLLGGRRS